MDSTRSALWIFGLLFIVGGALLLYMEAGLNRWVSIGVMVAGLLVFVGLAVMSFAGSAPTDTAATVVKQDAGVVVERQPVVVESSRRSGR